jgi:hypothetical protein
MLKISFLILISVGISMGCYRPWDEPIITTTPVPETTIQDCPYGQIWENGYCQGTCNGYFWSNGRFKRCTFTPTTIEITTTTTTTTEKTCPPNSVLIGNGECLDISHCGGYGRRYKRCTFTPTTTEITTTTTTTTEITCPPNSVLLGNGECLDISHCGGYGRRYKRCTVTTTPNVFYPWNWW